MAQNLTTKLEAINEILAHIGEPPTNSLDAGRLDVARAQRKLEETSKSLQGSGWWFNERTKTITPTSESEIVLPADTLSVTTPYLTGVFQLGQKLFSKDDDTTKAFTDDVEVELLVEVAWEDLPQQARSAIFVSAARQLQDEEIGDATRARFSREDEAIAMEALGAEDVRQRAASFEYGPVGREALLR